MFCVSAGLLSSLAFSQNYNAIIADYLSSSASFRENGSTKSFVVKNVDESNSLKGDLVYIEETLNGIPIYNSGANFLIKKNKVSYAKEYFTPASHTSASKKVKSINENSLDLFDIALTDLGIVNGDAYSFEKSKSKVSVNSKTIYYPKNNELRLAKVFDFEDINTHLGWHYIIDVETKKILSKQSLTVSCQVDHGAYDPILVDIKPESKTGFKPKFVEVSSADSSYDVFPFPTEAPSFGSMERVINPADLIASPEGWHSNGEESYTITRGNNTFTYSDPNNNDNRDGLGIIPDGGSTLQFHFPYSTEMKVNDYANAAVTNLFYATNKLHDLFYRFGFTESARNFQSKNFDKGGIEDDEVWAQARDNFSTEKINTSLNNANFTTYEEGYNAKMQMYVFSPVEEVYRLSISSPQELTEMKVLSKGANFGPVNVVEPISGALIKGNNVNNQECTRINDTAYLGKIVMIQRGSCAFSLKVFNAQQRGAIGVVIYDNDGAVVSSMGIGENYHLVKIPSVLISKEDGNKLDTLLKEEITASIQYKSADYKWIDASFDNGVIAHEYGHGVSRRLTGDGYSCLFQDKSNEQMGEGWSDFFALMFTNKPTYTSTTPRGIGSYSLGENTNGKGFRLAPYSTDFEVNNYTYGDTNSPSMWINYVDNQRGFAVHQTGFIWATMLWDLHWKYAEKYGYNHDILADPNSGSARVVQTVMDGLKLQPCGPSFVDGRNAIIEADKHLTGGENKCMIWSVFAKRGLGVNASSGEIKDYAFNGVNDQVEDFTIPAECEASLGVQEYQKVNNVKLYPNPAKDMVILQSAESVGKTNIKIYNFAGQLVLETFEDLKNGANINISKLANGIYIIKGEGVGANFTQKLFVKK